MQSPKAFHSDDESARARFDREYLRAEAVRIKHMTIKRRASTREFASVEHLNPEAVAAYVDNELSPMAVHRARVHLVHCEECRQEVNRQRAAAERLRKATADSVHASSDLMAKLTQIAQSCPAGPTADEIEAKSKSFLAKLDQMTRHKRNKK